jgi:3-phosphoshikimate 1-carboxyvinyltransferase
VTLPGWPAHTTQPGGELPFLLAAFGAECAVADGTLTVTGTGQPAPVDLNLHAVGELTPVIAAVAACASGRSHLRGVAHLRGHETDRLAALAAELSRVGAEVTETADGLIIDPPPSRRGALLRTYADHRMVHAAALIGLVTPDVVIENVGTVAKAMPTFCRLWSTMLTGAAG